MTRTSQNMPGPGAHVVDVIDFSSMQATVANPDTDMGASWTYVHIFSEDPDATIVLIEPTDTLDEIIRRIVDTCRARGKMDLIRFNGHGHPGQLLHGQLDELSAAREQTTLSRLRPYFNPNAEAYLLNCVVGQRPQILVSLARAWHIPVSAGVQQQLWGHDSSSLRFEGPTRTGHRNGRVEINRPSLPRDPNPHNNFPPVGPARIPGAPVSPQRRNGPIRIR